MTGPAIDLDELEFLGTGLKRPECVLCTKAAPPRRCNSVSHSPGLCPGIESATDGRAVLTPRQSRGLRGDRASNTRSIIRGGEHGCKKIVLKTAPIDGRADRGSGVVRGVGPRPAVAALWGRRARRRLSEAAREDAAAR